MADFDEALRDLIRRFDPHNDEATGLAIDSFVAARIREALRAPTPSQCLALEIADFVHDSARCCGGWHAGRIKARFQANGIATPDTDLIAFAKYVVQHDASKGAARDHVCAECWPNGDAVVAGFRCVFHRAKALLSGEATS